MEEDVIITIDTCKLVWLQMVDRIVIPENYSTLPLYDFNQRAIDTREERYRRSRMAKSKMHLQHACLLTKRRFEVKIISTNDLGLVVRVQEFHIINSSVLQLVDFLLEVLSKFNTVVAGREHALEVSFHKDKERIVMILAKEHLKQQLDYAIFL